MRLRASLPVTISSSRWLGDTAISTARSRAVELLVQLLRVLPDRLLEVADVDAEGQAGLLVGHPQRLVETQQLPGGERARRAPRCRLPRSSAPGRLGSVGPPAGPARSSAARREPAAVAPCSPAVTCASCRTGPHRRAGGVLDDAGLERGRLPVRGWPRRRAGLDLLGRGQEPDRLEVVGPAGTVAAGAPVRSRCRDGTSAATTAMTATGMITKTRTVLEYRQPQRPQASAVIPADDPNVNHGSGVRVVPDRRVSNRRLTPSGSTRKRPGGAKITLTRRLRPSCPGRQEGELMRTSVPAAARGARSGAARRCSLGACSRPQARRRSSWRPTRAPSRPATRSACARAATTT